MGWLEPDTWSLQGVQEATAGGIVWALDPIYGEGGILEPVTVIVDPDRTIVEEYVEPTAETITEVIVDPVKDIVEETIETGKDVYAEGKEVATDVALYALVAGAMVLLLRK